MSRSSKDLVQQVNVARQAQLREQQAKNNPSDPRVRRHSSLKPLEPAYHPSPPQPQFEASKRTEVVTDEALFSELQRKVDIQRSELDNRTDNVNAIQRNFQRLSDMYAADRKRIEALEEELRRANEELEALRSEKKLFDVVRQEYTALRKRYAALEEDNSANREGVQDEIRELRKQLLDVTAERDMMQRSIAECGDRLQYQDAMQQRMAKVTSQIERDVDETVSVTKGLMDALELEATGIALSGNSDGSSSGISLELRLEKSAKVLSVLAQRGLRPLHSNMSDKIRALEEEREASEMRMQGEYDALAIELKSANGEIAQLHTDLDETKSKLQALATRYSTEKQSMQRRNEELEAMVQSMSSESDTQVSQLRQNNETLRQDLEASELRAAELKAKLDAAMLEKDELAALKEEAHQRLALAERTTMQVRSDAERDLKLVQEQLLAEQKQHAEAITALKRDATAQMAESSAMYEAKIKRLEGDLAARPQINDVQSAITERDTKIRDSEAQMAILQHKLTQVESDLQHIITQLTNSSAEVTRLSGIMGDKDKRIAELEDQVAAVQHEANEWEASTIRKSEELARLTVENASLTQEVESLEQEAAELRAERGKLMTSLESLQAELSASSQSSSLHAAAKKNIEALETTIGQLKADLDKANSALAAEKLNATNAAMRRDAAVKEAQDSKKLADELLAAQEGILKQRLELEQRSVKASERAQQLRLVQEESVKAVKKLIAAEKSCESGYSCQNCMELFKDPVICAPCGHAYCRTCAPALSSACPECDVPVKLLAPSNSMDLLAAKFSYRCQVLQDLLSMVERELNKPIS